MHRNHLKLCTHHRNIPFWWENYVWSTHDRVHYGFHSWPMVLTFFHFLLLAWIFESLEIFTKSLETLQKSQTQSPLIKKLSFGNQRHILVLLHSLSGFSFIPFRGFICGIFGDLATHDNAWKSLETLQKSQIQSPLMKKLTLGYQRHILLLLHSLLDFRFIAFWHFICGIFGDLATHDNASKSLQNLHTSSKQFLLMRKLSLVYSW